LTADLSKCVKYESAVNFYLRSSLTAVREI
jgi:hypothetical protein